MYVGFHSDDCVCIRNRHRTVSLHIEFLPEVCDRNPTDIVDFLRGIWYEECWIFGVVRGARGPQSSTGFSGVVRGPRGRPSTFRLRQSFRLPPCQCMASIARSRFRLPKELVCSTDF